MINANELRRNNWILEGGKPIRVDEIRHWYFGDADPIPLTPEILEKAGFKDRKIPLGLLVFQVNEKGTADVYDPYVHASGVDFPCEYLHQLQNIYFALTGEELTINL